MSERKDIKIEWEIEELVEEYEWLVSYKEVGEASDDLVYVVSICEADIDWKNRAVKYIHIENIDYLYHIAGQDSEEEIYKCYDLFKAIEKDVVNALI